MRLISILASVVAASTFALAGCAADTEPTNTNNQPIANQPLTDENAEVAQPYDWQSEASRKAFAVGTDPIVRDAVTLPSHRIVNPEVEEVTGFGPRKDLIPQNGFAR